MKLLDLLAAPFRRGPRRPLAARKPAMPERSVPLGMEATDLDAVERVNRRNQSLERTSLARVLERGSFAQAADIAPQHFPDDETYAARYDRAFRKKD